MAGAERFDVLLQIPPEGGRFHIVAQRCTTHSSLKPGQAERGVLVLATKDAPKLPLPEAYSPTVVPPYKLKDFTKLYTKLKARNGLQHPYQEPDVHFMVRLTGDFDKVTGEWRPGFHINGERVYVWPNRVWCRDTCAEQNYNPDGTVVNMIFCQGEERDSNLPCRAFACDPGSEGRNADGRCMPAGATMDEWRGVSVDDCENWHVRPKLFQKVKGAMEVCQGDRVWITYQSDTANEGHPMHLHGTHQQLIKVNGEDVTGPMKDTWFVPGGQNITVAFDAVNPGEWLLHCHIGHHVGEGMATTLRYTGSPEKCRNHRSYIPTAEDSSQWRHTAVLPESEWPTSWQQLWQGKPPVP